LKLKLFSLALLVCAVARGELLTPVWVALAEGEQAVARVVVSDPASCPTAVVDGVSHPLTLRRPVPDGLRPACEVAIPGGTRSASVNGQALKLPKPGSSRVVVLGDTGCRIKGERVQECANPDEWPFERVALSAAAARPDVVVHVGDYLYREEKCPREDQCGNTSGGDIWEAWNADFFAPAAKLLSAAPWAFARGNHEACSRSWRGWFYYLDPRPWTNTCDSFSPPYTIKQGAFEVVVFDSSSVTTDKVDQEQVSKYAAQLAQVRTTNAWLVAHHPFWGIKTDPQGGPSVPLVTSLADAWTEAQPHGINLVVSGHVHMFALLSFNANRPPQLVAGDSGADLAAPAGAVNGLNMTGASVVASESQRQFGFSILTQSKDGWELVLNNRVGQAVVTCNIRHGRTSC